MRVLLALAQQEARLFDERLSVERVAALLGRAYCNGEGLLQWEPAHDCQVSWWLPAACCARIGPAFAFSMTGWFEIAAPDTWPHQQTRSV